jgi:hypothetical protein
MNHDEAISIDGSDCFGWTRGLHLEFKLQTNNLLKQKIAATKVHLRTAVVKIVKLVRLGYTGRDFTKSLPGPHLEEVEEPHSVGSSLLC